MLFCLAFTMELLLDIWHVSRLCYDSKLPLHCCLFPHCYLCLNAHLYCVWLMRELNLAKMDMCAWHVQFVWMARDLML